MYHYNYYKVEHLQHNPSLINVGQVHFILPIDIYLNEL